MTVTSEILQKQWESIDYMDGGFLQINTIHPLEWHIGYQSISQRTLLMVCDVEIDSIESSKSMIVTRRIRETDNRWTLTFELLRDEQQDVFAIFCCDIIEYSTSGNNEVEALNLVIDRYKQWSLLLELQKTGVMNESRRKGLIGELLFLEQRIENMDSPLAAIQGWAGAESADQDFMYSDGWFEVKSIGVSAESVAISSIEQLDCKDIGELIIMRIDKVALNRNGAFSLNDITYRLFNKLQNNSNAHDLLRTKLTAYGYMDLQEYSEHKYYHSGTQRYLVDESFPRLTRQLIPIQVVSSRYELSISAINNWQRG